MLFNIDKEKKIMRKTIFPIILILIILIIPISSYANSESELQVGVFGASILIGIDRVGCFIHNSGNEVIDNIIITFKVQGRYNNAINLVINDNKDLLQPNSSYIITTNTIRGFGPIELSIQVTSSNAGSAEKTINGFQIGDCSITQSYLFAWM
jgi:hypothetical protein